MLSVKNLTKIYKSDKSAATTALAGISVTFPSRGLVFVLGKSGSGKSTLLNLIGGIDGPTSGEIIIDGRSGNSFSEKELDAYRNEGVGFVFQDYNLIDTYTVGQNIAVALELQGRKANKADIEALLKKLALQDDNGRTFYDRKVHELSGGQKQRVAIARALVKNARIILADEPTGALDRETGEELYGIMKSLSKDRLVIVVTHDEESAAKYGDRVIELKDGQIVRDELQRHKAEKIETSVEAARVNSGKGRLRFGRTFLMGVSAIKAKPFRLIVMMIVALLSFVILGFSFTALFTDEISCEMRTISDKGYSVVRVYKTVGFSESEFEMIHSYTGYESHYVISDYRLEIDAKFTSVFGVDDEIIYGQRNPYVNFASSPANFVEVDPDTGEDELRLAPDKRFKDKTVCRLPAAYDEMAITDIYADMFIRYGYRNADGTVTNISSPDDLIGLKLNEYKITGVYSTEQDADYFRQYDINNFGLTPQQIAEYDRDGLNITNNEADYEWMCTKYSSADTIISCAFVLTGLFEHKIGRTMKEIMFRLSGDLDKNIELIKKLAGGTDPDNVNNRFMLYTPITNFVSRAAFFFEFIIVALIVSALFAVFAILLMMNYFSVSMDYRHRELGILRALGAGKKELTFICLSESLLLACALFVAAIIGALTLCAVINGAFMVSLYFFGIIPLAMLFLVCFGSCALSTLIPVIRLNKKKPIDIINDEK